MTKSIEEALKKYTKEKKSFDQGKDSIIKAIENNTGIILEANNIEIKEGVIRINTNSLIKKEILMRQSSILKEIKETNPSICSIN